MQPKSFYGKTAHETKAKEALNGLFHKYKFLGAGNNRAVFQLKNYVLKFPICDKGKADNIHEAKYSGINIPNKDYLVQTPKARLINYEGFDCLLMEYVSQEKGMDIVTKLDKVPPWIHGVDCMQVGYTRSGRLVAYDYGTF